MFHVKQSEFHQTIMKDVSRETLMKLELYQSLLHSWNQTINLVSNQTLSDSWNRHFMDSLQIIPLIQNPQNQVLVDLGSGAGFPGMVLAITGTFKHVTLFEIDQRKSVFLREIARQTATNVEIVNSDYKKGIPLCNLVTARGLDKIKNIAQFIKPFVTPKGYGLFLKGKNYADELKMLESNSYTLYSSITSLDSTIIKIEF